MGKGRQPASSPIFFFENCMKMKKFWRRSGKAPVPYTPRSTYDPVTDDILKQCIFLLKKQKQYADLRTKLRTCITVDTLFSS